MVDSEFGEIPEEWKIGYLGDEILTSLIKPNIDKFTGEKIYIDTSSVENSDVTKIDYKITYNKRPSRANMQPRINTVWFAKMKDSHKILMFDKYSSYWLDNFILSTGFAGLNVVESALYYIWSLVSSERFEKMKDNLCNGTTMQAINNEGIKTIKIVIPKREILIKFNEISKPIHEKIYQNRLQIQYLTQIRDMLLPKLISGKIRVPVEG